MSDPAAPDAGLVLIVDDNADNLALLGGVLVQAGYRVRGTASGHEALAIASARAMDLDLILLDLRMPDLDGFEVCRRLKEDIDVAAIPVLVLSALDDPADKVKAFEAGAVDYITKPFHGPEVLARVGSHLSLYRLQRLLVERNAELAKKNTELERAHGRTGRVFDALQSALPGSVLDGRYRLDEKIGAGGFGTVFRGRHLHLDRDVAVKVFVPWEDVDNAHLLELFGREGMAASRLNHPNVVAVHDCGVSQTGISYLVMELLDGHTLEVELRRTPVVSLERCAEVLAPVCAALAAAHSAGLVHRDVKPENIFLHRGPRGEAVKVLDWGIAKFLADNPEATRPSHGVIGTPAYVAPERMLGQPYDGRADIFSVGVLLYRMLAGRLPFGGTGSTNAFTAAMRSVSETPAPLARPDLPPEIQRMVMLALSKEPGRRPLAGDMHQALAVLR